MCEFELQKGSELALRTNKPLAHFPEISFLVNFTAGSFNFGLG